jgi:hypothetical protein
VVVATATKESGAKASGPDGANEAENAREALLAPVRVVAACHQGKLVDSEGDNSAEWEAQRPGSTAWMDQDGCPPGSKPHPDTGSEVVNPDAVAAGRLSDAPNDAAGPRHIPTSFTDIVDQPGGCHRHREAAYDAEGGLLSSGGVAVAGDQRMRGPGPSDAPWRRSGQRQPL